MSADIPEVRIGIKVYRYRCLFSNGQVVDFLCPGNEGSTLRSLMLEWMWPKKVDRDVAANRIEGVTRLDTVDMVGPGKSDEWYAVLDR